MTNLTVTSNAGQVVVQLTGSSGPEIAFLPATLVLGLSAPVGGSAAATFTIQNTGTADLHVESVALDLLGTPAGTFSLTFGSPGFCSQPPLTIRPGSECTVLVTLRPPAEATYQARVHVLSDDSDEPDVQVAITGIGVAGDVDLDGVSVVEEQGPSGQEASYDGNGDGLPDRQQANVASLDSLDRQKYLTISTSVLWSQYGDILGDGEASSAYIEWAALMNGGIGMALDIGSAVGRFAFEMTRKSDFVVGIDNSLSFIQSARELMIHGRKEVALPQEGLLSREDTVALPAAWLTDKIEFIVADALALPFRSGTFSALASLNLIDKVPNPLKHLQEMNRVARDRTAELLLSDPFSWSAETAREEDWLGGKDNGPYSGRGMDNIIALLEGENRQLLPAWRIVRRGHVWWKIRNHANHLSRSPAGT